MIGGYLAFIGWFCGVAGVEMMAGSSKVTLQVVWDKLLYVLPGVVSGFIIYLAVRRIKHVAVLPTGILLVIAIFYGALWTSNKTVADATNDEWIRQMDVPPVWYHTWDFLRLDKVAWGALPSLALTELSMIFVVALSSSLDVAAIELDLKRPLDYNHELRMVGLSNAISGLTGGYTGSYIFSQSIFSMRAGIRSRLAGYVLALCETVIIVLPFPLLAFVPNFFFGAMLSMICIDLMFEWLWDVREKITRTEHAITLATFFFIQILGVEYGILAGVGLFLTCEKAGLDVGGGKHVPMPAEEGAKLLQVDLPSQYGTV